MHRGARANISKLLGKTRPEDVAVAFTAMTPDAQMSVFKVLMEDCDVHTVLRLPRGTFNPYTDGTLTNVVFFTQQPNSGKQGLRTTA